MSFGRRTEKDLMANPAPRWLCSGGPLWSVGPCLRRCVLQGHIRWSKQSFNFQMLNSWIFLFLILLMSLWINPPSTWASLFSDSRRWLTQSRPVIIKLTESLSVLRWTESMAGPGEKKWWLKVAKAVSCCPLSALMVNITNSFIGYFIKEKQREQLINHK